MTATAVRGIGTRSLIASVHSFTMTDEMKGAGTEGDSLVHLQAYQLAMQAGRDARLDAGEVRDDSLLGEIAGQLMRSAGSIGANIAEGYSRGTTADRRRFFEYALGSARECIVWYETAARFPSSRIERLVSIRRLLITMIRNSRLTTAADRKKFQY